MKQDTTRELFDYWNTLRGDRAAPERSDIDPTAIRGILADVFMLDLDTVRTFAFRLAGTRVNGLFDAEQKGRSFLELWRPEERRNVAAILMTVADGACPVVVGAAGAPGGHEECGFELLFLPLRHFGRTHSRILGVITATTRPAWLGLLPPAPLALRSLRVVDEAPVAPAKRANRFVVGSPILGAQVEQAFAEQAFVEQPFEAVPDGLMIANGVVLRERPRLRLIHGGRATE